MLSGTLLDYIETLGQRLRGGNRPFGGLQLVFTGDFHQLPPVNDDYQEEHHHTAPYAFQAQCWDLCFEHQYALTRIYRQREQATLTVEMFIGANWNAIEKFTGSAITYIARDQPTLQRSMTKRLQCLFAILPAESVLNLKVGGPVMLLRNMPEHLTLVKHRRGEVRGFTTIEAWRSRGSIANFSSTELLPQKATTFRDLSDSNVKFPVVEFEAIGCHEAMTVLVTSQDWGVSTRSSRGSYRPVVGYRQQLPLQLGFAYTVRSIQGNSLKRAKINIQWAWEAGHAYTAFSCVTSIARLEVVPFVWSKIITDDAIAQWSRMLKVWQGIDNGTRDEDDAMQE
ncbi:hypothetical protein DACRYDRAFT_112373 [Dacryopinax primogenitus]|uniref:ATP-dependent DNA helicase n=1 Tax=Dacryopinax primogenitus (strain DJM 731) TaxID=1858805 RepID=M5FZV9_DACPD|nr:uncharacterized protein DACRYDRAFT_112373 [Dacryopinax primogenitus]EJT97047.1 hypothetical protein DACRYDRAFT_112373 [Dacryopinax primogenitus]